MTTIMGSIAMNVDTYIQHVVAWVCVGLYGHIDRACLQHTAAAVGGSSTRRVDHAGAYKSLVELVDAQLGLTAPLQGRINLEVVGR